MDQFVSFLTQHWVLSALFVVLLLALLGVEAFTRSRKSEALAPEAVVQLMNHENAQLIDVRTNKAFVEGHILGSLNIPITQLDNKLDALLKYKSQPIIIVCQLGQDSFKILPKIKEQGLNAVLLEGGIQAWRSAGLPVVKK